jgi:hypothetical protein
VLFFGFFGIYVVQFWRVSNRAWRIDFVVVFGMLSNLMLLAFAGLALGKTLANDFVELKVILSNQTMLKLIFRAKVASIYCI